MSLIAYITRIHFADGVLEDGLADELNKLGIRRPMIVTDATIETTEIIAELLDALPPDICPIGPSGAPVCPDRGWIGQMRGQAGSERCDAIIGFGGVRALDGARVLGARGWDGKRVPVIALPTTTQSVGLGPVAGGLEAAVPALIVCDPILTTAASPLVTAAAGMDALTHCIEAYLGTAWNPPADGIAIDGARRAIDWLERAVNDGGDLEARREMLAAALNAGLAAQKGLGGVHALSWAIEAEPAIDVPHGMLHAALLPPVLSFNHPATADRHDTLRSVLRMPPDTDLASGLAELGNRIGLPGRLGNMAFDDRALRRIAARAAENPANRSNPRHATPADYHNLLQAAM